VIVRISSNAVPETNIGAYLEYVERNELPLYESTPGLIKVWVLQRPFVAYTEVVVLSVWKSEEFMTGFVEKHPVLEEVKRDYGAIPLEARAYGFFASRDGDCRATPNRNREQAWVFSWAVISVCGGQFESHKVRK
jgi:heme-degrading monooxygenase HmoA